MVSVFTSKKWLCMVKDRLREREVIQWSYCIKKNVFKKVHLSCDNITHVDFDLCYSKHMQVLMFMKRTLLKCADIYPKCKL